MRKIVPLLTLLCLALTAGCNQDNGATGAFSENNSATLVPADPDLAAIYNRSCRSCHTVAATGSPLTGDRAAWAPRLEKGMDVLVDNVVGGFGGMPPFGLCMDCDAGQFEALIDFMSTAGRAAP
ncbi:MAG: cytochrome c5 family protein [Halioglobus sp.]|nr:cytochrome c5 family protein [Halioglobus sp.]|tara:strand:- start:2985 stop:3356 length:372 start_codon:yes stop_codon:yes gene_type:complete